MSIKYPTIKRQLCSEPFTLREAVFRTNGKDSVFLHLCNQTQLLTSQSEATPHENHLYKLSPYT